MIKIFKKYILHTTIIGSSFFLLLFIAFIYYYGPYLTQKTQVLLSKHEGRIVVSLTTTPYRIHNLDKTLNSLKQQSIQPDTVYLNIPDIFARENMPYTIPTALANDPYITIIRDQDYGPATKLLPILKQETDPNTIIITVDDDIFYHQQVFRDLILGILSNTNTAVTTIPISFHYYDESPLILYTTTNAVTSHLVTGFSGIAYKRSFFEEDIWTFMSQNKLSCYLSDDLTLSIYLKKQNIRIQCPQNFSFMNKTLPVAQVYDIFFKIFSQYLPQSNTIDALSMGANAIAPHPSTLEGYSQCLAHLLADPNKRSYASAYINSLPHRPSDHT